MSNYDVVVVGNGILGLTVSYFLKKKDPSLKVALIGKKSRPGCATLAAAAMLNLWCEIGPGQFENEALAKRFSLTRQGFDNWSAFAKDLSETTGESINLKWGTYLLRTLHGTEIEDNAYKYIKKSLVRFGIEHRILGAEDLPWHKPAQNSRLIEALWVPDGSIDSRKVIRALDRAMEILGVDTFDQHAKNLTANSEKKLSFSRENNVGLEDGTKVVGKHIVLANGAFAQALIDQVSSLKEAMPRLLFGIGAGIDIKFPKWISEYGGLGKEILGLNEVMRTADRGGACGVHVVPYENGEFYAGASSLTSLDDDREPKIHGMHSLLHSLINEMHCSFFNAGMTTRSNGFRPTSADCYPLLGETNKKGIWMLNGTKRDGFTMSPHISRQIANAILGEKSTLPEMFKPCRNLISYKTKERAIKDAEFMYIGADYQHGGMVAPYMIDKYRDMRRKEIENPYNLRNIQDFGIHPELIHLYENDNFYKEIEHPRDKQPNHDFPIEELKELFPMKPVLAEV